MAFEGKFASLASVYGFSPIATPAFEHTEVFERGVGEATDIVSKEMYTFDDRGDRSLTLRPEGTAPVVRSYIEHGVGKSAQLPWKVYYAGTMWRYERPQAGRMREFRQVGAESIGSGDPICDVELIDFAARFFADLGIAGVELLLNSMGDSQCRPDYARAFAAHLMDSVSANHPLCEDCARRLDQNPLRILDCKKPGCRELTADAPSVIEYLCGECAEHFEMVRGGLSAIGLSYRIEPRLVRGLDYYTRTTFEFRCDALGAAQDALGGGGRYDGLVAVLGGEPTPALGFAIGTERTMAAIEASGIEHSGLTLGDDLGAVVVPLTSEARDMALRVASLLRSSRISSDLASPGRSAKSQLRRASKLQARVAILIGDDELRDGVVTVRFMSGREGLPDQVKCSVDELTGVLVERGVET